MYKREAEKIIRELSQPYPVVAVTGPRQSGKTTLVKAIFKIKEYVSLEDLDQKAFAEKDSRGFLSQSKNGLLIDKIQNCPDLFSRTKTTNKNSKQIDVGEPVLYF